ncbi:hypothetical protein NE237_023559 [Protea cynaroides]|uniref:Uncharacterized protein n=1 Tax=Protea cynaroides TaxID=273540 RepID=A0A9Q0K682_9MAGN|nr:hypothetical protein NE237_023559 [Protea cynaroides]
MGLSQQSCIKVGRKWNRPRGFRLSPRRFSVYRLRVKFLYLVRLLRRWKSSYGQAIESLKKGIGRCSSSNRSCKGMTTMEERSFDQADCRLKTYRRSNSFYSEAIADCLEFIKRSSVSVNDNSVVRR